MGKTRKPIWKQQKRKPAKDGSPGERNGCKKCVDGTHPKCRGKGCRWCNFTGRCQCAREAVYA